MLGSPSSLMAAMTSGEKFGLRLLLYYRIGLKRMPENILRTPSEKWRATRFQKRLLTRISEHPTYFLIQIRRVLRALSISATCVSMTLQGISTEYYEIMDGNSPRRY